MKTITLQISDESFNRLESYMESKKAVLGHDAVDSLVVDLLEAMKNGYTILEVKNEDHQIGERKYKTSKGSRD